MIITEIKHLNVRISEFEDNIIDDNILPIFTTPLIIKEVEARKRGKYKIETLNPERKLTFRKVTQIEIVTELAARINKVALKLEPYYFINPSHFQSLPIKLRNKLEINLIKNKIKDIKDTSIQVKKSTIKGRKLIPYIKFNMFKYLYKFYKVNKFNYKDWKILFNNQINLYDLLNSDKLNKLPAVKIKNLKLKNNHLISLMDIKLRNKNKYDRLRRRSFNNFKNISEYGASIYASQLDLEFTGANKIKKRWRKFISLLRRSNSRRHKNYFFNKLRIIKWRKSILRQWNKNKNFMLPSHRSRTWLRSVNNNYKKNLFNLFSLGWRPKSKGALMLLEDEGWDLDLLSNKNNESQLIKNLKPYNLIKFRRLRRLKRLRLMSINLFLHRSDNIKNFFKQSTASLPNVPSKFNIENYHSYSHLNLTERNNSNLINSSTRPNSSLQRLQLQQNNLNNVENTSIINKNNFLIKQNNNKLNFIINSIGDKENYYNLFKDLNIKRNSMPVKLSEINLYKNNDKLRLNKKNILNIFLTQENIAQPIRHSEDEYVYSTPNSFIKSKINLSLNQHNTDAFRLHKKMKGNYNPYSFNTSLILMGAIKPYGLEELSYSEAEQLRKKKVMLLRSLQKNPSALNLSPAASQPLRSTVGREQTQKEENTKLIMNKSSEVSNVILRNQNIIPYEGIIKKEILNQIAIFKSEMIKGIDKLNKISYKNKKKKWLNKKKNKKKKRLRLRSGLNIKLNKWRMHKHKKNQKALLPNATIPSLLRSEGPRRNIFRSGTASAFASTLASSPAPKPTPAAKPAFDVASAPADPAVKQQDQKRPEEKNSAELLVEFIIENIKKQEKEWEYWWNHEIFVHIRNKHGLSHERPIFNKKKQESGTTEQGVRKIKGFPAWILPKGTGKVKSQNKNKNKNKNTATQGKNKNTSTQGKNFFKREFSNLTYYNNVNDAEKLTKLNELLRSGQSKTFITYSTLRFNLNELSEYKTNGQQNYSAASHPAASQPLRSTGGKEENNAVKRVIKNNILTKRLNIIKSKHKNWKRKINLSLRLFKKTNIRFTQLQVNKNILLYTAKQEIMLNKQIIKINLNEYLKKNINKYTGLYKVTPESLKLSSNNRDYVLTSEQHEADSTPKQNTKSTITQAQKKLKNNKVSLPIIRQGQGKEGKYSKKKNISNVQEPESNLWKNIIKLIKPSALTKLTNIKLFWILIKLYSSLYNPMLNNLNINNLILPQINLFIKSNSNIKILKEDNNLSIENLQLTDTTLQIKDINKKNQSLNNHIVTEDYVNLFKYLKPAYNKINKSNLSILRPMLHNVTLHKAKALLLRSSNTKNSFAVIKNSTSIMPSADQRNKTFNLKNINNLPKETFLLHKSKDSNVIHKPLKITPEDTRQNRITLPSMNAQPLLNHRSTSNVKQAINQSNNNIPTSDHTTTLLRSKQGKRGKEEKNKTIILPINEEIQPLNENKLNMSEHETLIADNKRFLFLYFIVPIFITTIKNKYLRADELKFKSKFNTNQKSTNKTLKNNKIKAKLAQQRKVLLNNNLNNQNNQLRSLFKLMLNSRRNTTHLRNINWFNLSVYTPAKWYPILRSYAAPKEPEVDNDLPLHLHNNNISKLRSVKGQHVNFTSKGYSAQQSYKVMLQQRHSSEKVNNNNINNLMKAFNYNLLNNKKNLIKKKPISNIEKLTLNLIKWSILFIVQSLIPLKRKQDYYNFILLKIFKDKKNKLLYGKYNALLSYPHAGTSQVNEVDQIKQTFKVDDNLSTINTLAKKKNQDIHTKSLSFQLNSVSHNLPIQEVKQPTLNFITTTSHTSYNDSITTSAQQRSVLLQPLTGLTLQKNNQEGNKPKVTQQKLTSSVQEGLEINQINKLVTYYPGGRYFNDWHKITKAIWQEEYIFNVNYNRIKKSLNLIKEKKNKPIVNLIQSNEYIKNFNNLVDAKSIIIGKIKSIKLIELIDKIKEESLIIEKLNALIRVADFTDLNKFNKKKYRRINASKYLNKKNINKLNRIKILQTIKTIKTEYNFESKIDGNSLSIVPVPLLYYSNLKKYKSCYAVKTKVLLLRNSNNNNSNNNGNATDVKDKLINTAPHRQIIASIRKGEENNPILSAYLREMSIYNRETKGIMNYYSRIIGYNFNSNSNKISSSIFDLLEATFKTMRCFISKPIFTISPKKITIQLFYFLLLPKRKNKMYRYKNILKKNKRKKYKKWKKKQLIIINKLNSKAKKDFKLNNIFPDQLKWLCEILNKIFNKPVELDLIRLHYPSGDPNILVKIMGLMINNIHLSKIFGSVYKGTIIKTLINHKKYKHNDISIIPAFLTGLNIKIAGRIMTQKARPRHTINLRHRGAIARGKVNYLNFARLTNKNKRGSYSISILAAQNYFK